MKKREERIKTASVAICKANRALYKQICEIGEYSRIDVAEDVHRIAFQEGVIWAEKHPNWISVDDELPKPFIEGHYPIVLVALEDGYITTDSYNYDEEVWFDYDGEVTHWMWMPFRP